MGAPGAVETEEQEINPPVKMRLERSAERDKREIINNLSLNHAQSNAEGILNRLTSHKRSTPIMMLDRMEGNAELKTSVHQMLASRRLTHSVLLVGEEGLGTGFAARCVAADYLYPNGGAPAEALLRGECCRAVAKALTYKKEDILDIEKVQRNKLKKNQVKW